MNTDDNQDTYIDTNTLVFAKSIIYALEDMLGKSFTLNNTSYKETAFSSPFDMVACVHFTGNIQGDYLLGLDEALAAKLIDIYEDGMAKNDLREMREDYGSFIKELLNIAVGLSIPELEQDFNELTYSSGILVYGEIELPDVKSGSIFIESEYGKILCGFSLNLAQVKIGRTLEKILREVERISNEARRARNTTKTVLRLFHSALIAVNPEGKILPGYSHTPALISGFDPNKEIMGMDLATLLGLKHADAQTLNNIFQGLIKNGPFFIDDISLPNKTEFTNEYGKVLKLDWVPVINDKSKCLEKILVIMENIS